MLLCVVLIFLRCVALPPPPLKSHLRVCVLSTFHQLPDIQIKHSELLQPLQGLAQRDAQLARMVVESLFKGVLQELNSVLSEREASRMRDGYNGAIVALLDKTRQGHTPFVATLHNLLRSCDPTKAKPMAVSLTSTASHSFHTGALLLESALMASEEQQHATAPAAKRSKTRGQGLNADEVDRWIHLGRLFKELGDYDTLHGIFSSETSSSDTQRAARLEAGGRVDEAAAVYKECLFQEEGEADDNVPRSEIDLWEENLCTFCSQWSGECV